MRILLAFVLMLFVWPVFDSDIHVVPEDIRSYFNKNGCSEIFDYYLEKEVIEKPYLYGVKSVISEVAVANDYSFIAWCKTDNARTDGAYVLVSNIAKKSWPGGCEFPALGFDYPGGLSIARRKIELSNFIDSKYKVVGNKSVFGPVIRSENDGLVSEIYCHRGAWVQRNYD